MIKIKKQCKTHVRASLILDGTFTGGSNNDK